MRGCISAFLVLLLFSVPALAQTAQVGGNARAKSSERLQVEYVHYRPAQWETEKVKELESEHPNQGGMVYVYFRNRGDKAVDLKYWRVNRQDESYWRLNHFVAWDRTYRRHLEPGDLSVIEINGITKDFAPGSRFSFAYVDRSWRPAGQHETTLEVDPIQIACIRVLPGMQELEVHVRYTGESAIRLESVAVEGHESIGQDWRGSELDGPGHAIARVKLSQPLQPSELIVVKLDAGGGRRVYAHRRAFEDYFPIGTWSGNTETYGLLRRLHIDTIVQGGHSTDPFYSELAEKYGFRTMVHTGLPVNVDVVRDLATQAPVACWMLQDEPDWSIPANIMLFADETVRHYDKNKPTFITLCRNTKFFDYAAISDIPCMDHYAVTAPSSSKWPKFYGTRLEETAWYTRDLKYASEPKPIWIWSQAIASWGERPKRPVPTPQELAVQLVLNLGRGAKGILWFNYEHKVAEKYPDVREAMQRWGRVMLLLRDDFLASEPVSLAVKAPELVDVAPLVNRDKLILCVTNTDYDLHPEAYPFRKKEGVEVSVACPSWVKPAVALCVDPDGVKSLPMAATPEGRVKIGLGSLDDCAVVVLANDAGAEAVYQERFKAAIEEESRTFP